MRLFALWVQAGLKTLIRTPRSAFFTLVFPMILLLLIDSTNSGTVTASGGKVDVAQYFTPSLAIFGLSFACYTSLVFSIPRAREQGILKRIRGTPLEPSIYLSALIAVALLSGVASVVLMVIVGVAAFGVQLQPQLLPAALVTLLLGGLCLASLGIAVSSFVVRADTAPVVANVTLLPLTFISGVFSPMHGAPEWVTKLADFFPLKHLVDAFYGTFNPHTTGTGFAWGDLAVLVVWTLLGARVAVRRFRWDPVGPHHSRGGQREPDVSAATG
jgi:ABC-2 type transport system permease protein